MCGARRWVRACVQLDDWTMLGPVGFGSREGTACMWLSKFLGIGWKMEHLMTLNEVPYNMKMLAMLSLITEFSQGFIYWPRSKNTGCSMPSQLFFILEEVMTIFELWTLFPGRSTQHIGDVVYHLRRVTGTIWSPPVKWGCQEPCCVCCHLDFHLETVLDKSIECPLSNLDTFPVMQDFCLHI